MEPSPDPVTRRAGGRRGSARRAAGIALVAVLAISGAGLLVAAFYAPTSQPPQPTADAAPDFLRPSAAPTGTASAEKGSTTPTDGGSSTATPGEESGAGPSAHPTNGSADPSSKGPGGIPADVPSELISPVAELTRLIPLDLAVPAIKVNTRVMSLGSDKQGRVQVPPRSKAQFAGWYAYGPSPGEIGNAVFVGHVDTAKAGPAVFYRLGALKQGDAIHVRRKDGSVVNFTVDGVKAYPKATFPTNLVYGPSDRPGLRLVTCGGPWTKKAAYRDNVIVFATMNAD